MLVSGTGALPQPVLAQTMPLNLESVFQEPPSATNDYSQFPFQLTSLETEAAVSNHK